MKQQTQTEQTIEQVVTFQTAQDVKTAVLIVSVVANLAVFVLWLMLQLSTRFDSAVATWLVG